VRLGEDSERKMILMIVTSDHGKKVREGRKETIKDKKNKFVIFMRIF